MAQLLRELFCRLRLAVGVFAVWQAPCALVTKRQNEKPAKSKFVFFAICGDANCNGVLWHITTQSTMEFVPPAKNCAPIGIGLALHNRMMNTVHPRRHNDQVQN